MSCKLAHSRERSSTITTTIVDRSNFLEMVALIMLGLLVLFVATRRSGFAFFGMLRMELHQSTPPSLPTNSSLVDFRPGWNYDPNHAQIQQGR